MSIKIVEFNPSHRTRSDKPAFQFGYVRNVFDVDYFEQLALPSGSTGLIVGQPGDPRTYGLTLAITF